MFDEPPKVTKQSASYPLWVLVGTEDMKQMGLPDALRMFASPLFGDVLALFATSEAGEKYVTDSGHSEWGVAPISNPKELYNLFHAVELIGVKYVAFNPSADSADRTPIQCAKLTDAIRALTNPDAST